MGDQENVLQAAAEAAGPAVTESAPMGRSVVDRIRERHAQRKPYIERPIPEWEGDVVVRYGRISKKALAQSTKLKLPASSANAELLAFACQEVYVRDEQGNLRPARETDNMEAPIRFDGRLADLFGLSVEHPRDIVRAMYADDVAVGKDAQRIIAWQTAEDLGDDLDEVEDDLGEAGAAT